MYVELDKEATPDGMDDGRSRNGEMLLDIALAGTFHIAIWASFGVTSETRRVVATGSV